jgi:hypothetical protein
MWWSASPWVIQIGISRSITLSHPEMILRNLYDGLNKLYQSKIVLAESKTNFRLAASQRFTPRLLWKMTMTATNAQDQIATKKRWFCRFGCHFFILGVDVFAATGLIGYSFSGSLVLGLCLRLKITTRQAGLNLRKMIYHEAVKICYHLSINFLLSLY